MVARYNTRCCALGQLGADNYDTLEGLKREIASMKRHQEVRAIFCITTVDEPELEKNLQTLKFKHVNTFKRKKCYPQTDLKMWVKNY